MKVTGVVLAVPSKVTDVLSLSNIGLHWDAIVEKESEQEAQAQAGDGCPRAVEYSVGNILYTVPYAITSAPVATRYTELSTIHQIVSNVLLQGEGKFAGASLSTKAFNMGMSVFGKARAI
jgi:hypothetical protein